MVNVKVGDNVKVEKVGASSKGKWVMCKAESDNGKESIKVWASNSDAIPDGTFACEIIAINEVRKTSHEYPKGSGKWYPDTVINATLKALGTPSAIDGFSNINDEDIPF